jgi:hypothetical protein
VFSHKCKIRPPAAALPVQRMLSRIFYQLSILCTVDTLFRAFFFVKLENLIFSSLKMLIETNLEKIMKRNIFSMISPFHNDFCIDFRNIFRMILLHTDLILIGIAFVELSIYNGALKNCSYSVRRFCILKKKWFR